MLHDMLGVRAYLIGEKSCIGMVVGFMMTFIDLVKFFKKVFKGIVLLVLGIGTFYP